MTPSILQQIGVSVLDYLFYESKYGLDSLKVLALCQIHREGGLGKKESNQTMQLPD